MTKYILTLLCLLGLMPVAKAQSTIIVDVIPSNTPANDAIHIAGNFQGWDPGSASHILTYDSIHNYHYYTLSAGAGSISFKFTRGSWSSVESDANGNFLQDRTYTQTNGDSVFLQILGWEDLNGGGSGGTSTAAENVSIMDEDFFMPQLNRNRRVWIYLPPDYDSTSNRYPVLYMHDGQNVFDVNTSFSGEWEVDETLNRLFSEGDPGIIVVATDNGGGERINEYTPWVNNTYGGGDGALYVDFLVNDLIPYVNANYRTLIERENTGILGSSLGGHISIYGGVKFQETFGKVGSFSPAYWINPEIFDFVSANPKTDFMRFYQVMGTPEGPTHINRMNAMHDSLLASGFDSNEVKTVVTSDGAHSEWYWAREFEAAYKWLFRNELTSSFESVQKPSSVRIAQNPVLNSQLSLEIQLAQSEDVSIEVLDSTGAFAQEIYSGRIASGTQLLNLDLSKWQLTRGTYFCVVLMNNLKETHKLVISELHRTQP